MITERVQINSFIDYDLVITYERDKMDALRISGHLFEAFDYWLHLTTYTDKKIAIVIPDAISAKRLQLAYEDKYLIPSRDKVGYAFGSIPIFVDNWYKNIACTRILHCSGYSVLDSVNYFGDITSFRCGLEPQDKKYLLLQDSRIYTDIPEKALIVHYPKKIPFEFYRRSKEPAEKKTLVYDNTTMRTLSEDEKQTFNKEDYLVVGSDIKLPVRNFMNRFNRYAYTPTKNSFDCSPRLISECAFFNKEVEYLVPDGYMDLDAGLFWRRHDLMTNFQSVVLAKGDEISSFIFGDIKEVLVGC